MDTMKQLIYTRRCPGRSIDGSPAFDDGYGIYSISNELVSSDIPRDAMLQYALMRDYSDDCDSFFYHVPEIGEPILCFHHKRTKEEDPNSFDRRSRVIINQALIGQFDAYPCEAFESTAWDAWKRPWHTFYDIKGEEEGLPIAKMALPDYLPNVDVGKVFPAETRRTMRERASSFAHDGRVDAIRIVLRELLEGDLKRSIVIRDSESNNRMWIAAIMYCLPLKVAKQISFCTLSTAFNIKGVRNNYYAVNPQTGRFEESDSSKPVSEECLRIKAQIIGAPVKEGTAAASSDYIEIDGAAKAVRVKQAALNEQDQYYTAVYKDDKAIMDFCMLIDENVTCRLPGAEIPKLYNAMEALGEKVVEPEEVMRQFTYILKWIDPQKDLAEYLIKKLCSNYVNLVEADSRNNRYGLYHCLREYAVARGYSEGIDEIDNAIILMITGYVDHGNESGLDRFLLSCDRDMTTPILKRVFSDDRIELKWKSWVSNSPRFCAKVLACYARVRHDNNSSLSKGLAVQYVRMFVSQASIVISEQFDAATYLFSGLPLDVDANSLLELSMTWLEEEKCHTWWLAAINTGKATLHNLVTLLSNAGKEEQKRIFLLESLSYSIKKKRDIEAELETVFLDSYSTDEDKIENFYSIWLELITTPKRDEKQIMYFLDSSKIKQYPNLFRKSIQKLDGTIHRSSEEVSVQFDLRLSKKIMDMHVKREEIKRSVLLQCLNGMNRCQDGMEIMTRFGRQINQGILAVGDFDKWDECKTLLIEKIVPSMQQDIYQAGISMFVFPQNLERQKLYYAELFARSIVKCTPENRLPERLCILMSAIHNLSVVTKKERIQYVDHRVESQNGKRADTITEMIMTETRELLKKEERLDRIYKKVNDNRRSICQPIVRDMVLQMLSDCGYDDSRRGSESIVSRITDRLFGRRKG